MYISRYQTNTIMKKIILLLAFFIVGQLSANDFKFDKEYYRCENKWVILPKKDTDTSFITGFVYLDREAGFTFSYEGDITTKDGHDYYTERQTSKESRIIQRLPTNCVLMAIVPEGLLNQSGLPAEPSWLAIYRKGEDEIKGLISRGWHFNHVGGSDIAIPLLLKAYAIEPHAESLEFELSYAYNATNQFEKAVEVLNKAIKHDAKNFWFLRELGYAYVHLDKVADAEKTYKKGIGMSSEKVQQSEMAFNMTGVYFRKKDKKKFDEWLAIAKKYTDADTPYYEPLQKLEANFGKE